MLYNEKRINEAFNKLTYEQQRDLLKQIERRNTIFDCQSSNSIPSENNDYPLCDLFKVLIDLTVNTIQFSSKIFIFLIKDIYKTFSNKKEEEKYYTENISPDVLAELTITKEEE